MYKDLQGVQWDTDSGSMKYITLHTYITSTDIIAEKITKSLLEILTLCDCFLEVMTPRETL